MKVLLINPPIKNFGETPAPPLGVAYLAAMLEVHGHETLVLDMPILHLQTDDVTQNLRTFQPDVVGITCMQQDCSHVLEIARAIRKTSESTKVVLGGPYPTFAARDILRNSCDIDMVVMNEGEYSFTEIANRLNSNHSLTDVAGIAFRQGSAIVETPARPFVQDLDLLPFPAKHLLPMQVYRERAGYATLITTRGCPYSCCYCSSSALWRHQVRAHSPVRVANELEILVKDYGFDRFFFVDDTFTYNAERTVEIMHLILERRLDITWFCNTRVDCLTLTLLEAMKAAGCRRITFGIESAVQRLRDSIGKSRVKTEYIVAMSRKAKSLGIGIKLNLMFGLDGETAEDVRANIELVRQLEPEVVTYSLLTRYPGTKVAEFTPLNGTAEEQFRALVEGQIRGYELDMGIKVQKEGAY